MRELKFKSFGKDKMQQIMQIRSEEFRQYTGIKDKNGTEIYEGDIILEWGSKYKIVYSAPSFRKVGIDNKRNAVMSDGFGQFPVYEYTIIGNIYEN